ncbi:MAG: hypothetical protein KKC37_17010 [Proteobacteria bacterium]|nr:hypothetical protein [Pseudomonadota bacterium]
MLIVNALRSAFGWSAMWIALATSAVIQLAVIGWLVVSAPIEAAPLYQAVIVGVLNTFVVFMAAKGSNQSIDNQIATRQEDTRSIRSATFWQSW